MLKALGNVQPRHLLDRRLQPVVDTALAFASGAGAAVEVGRA
jgi:hypothetical protein